MANILVAYSRLTALKQNLPTSITIESYYVEQYHKLLEAFRELLGDEIDDFKVPSEEIKPRITSYNTSTGSKTYSDESYCDKAKLLAGIDGLLNYVELTSNGEEKKKIIGFRAGIAED